MDRELHDLRHRRLDRFLHAVRDLMPLEDRHRRRHLEVHVRHIVETHLAHQEFLDPVHSGIVLGDAVGLALTLGLCGFESFLLKLGGRLGDRQGTFGVGGSFVGVAVAFHFGQQFAVFGAPQFGHAIEAGGSEAFAVRAHRDRGHRATVVEFPNQLAPLELPVAELAISAAREKFPAVR